MGSELLAAIALSVIAAAALGLFARMLRQPLILGYIIGGVVLGRHLGLGVVSDEARIEVISEIGLICLLFIIGLEIDVPRVLQAGRTILVLGLLQFPLCAALTWYALGGAVSGFGGRLDAFYIAVALSLSSTLIVVKLVYDKLEISTFAGKLTLGVLIFQDLWAISFLALQPNLDRIGAGPLLRSLAAGAALVGMAARALRIFPLSALRRLGLRTAGVVAINLSQVSEFSLVIVNLGVEQGHVSPDVAGVVLYTLLLTAVLSTYGILYNHQIATGVGRALGSIGIPQWMARRRAPRPTAEPRGRPQDFFLLGVSREGLGFLQRLEGTETDTKRRILAIDFNPETLERLQAQGVECMYGDISNTETLHHAGIERATIVVSSISDSFLRGTTNLTLLQVVRSLAPNARIVATAETLADAEKLYGEGAHYVLIPPALAAEHLYKLLARPSDAALQAARRRQAADVFGR